MSFKSAVRTDIPVPPPPTASSVQSLRDWDVLVKNTAARVAASGEKWRTGLATFIALITSVLIFKGPDSLLSVDLGWRVAILALFVGGLAAALWGLWAALSASAGTLKLRRLDDVLAEYGSVSAYEVAHANGDARKIQYAKARVVLALILLIVGVLVWSLAPPSDAGKTIVTVVTPSGEICGELISAVDGRVSILRADDTRPLVLNGVTGFALVDACG